MNLSPAFPSGYEKTGSGLFVSKTSTEVDKSYTYSDGVEIESSIYKILSNASDVSSLSVELQGKIVDWPTNYYLSPRRANLLRPLESLLKGRVLEVGAGCGAITRYLAEVAEEVVAVEGSAARAISAVERVRDLDNTSIVRSLFQDFRSDDLFDAVICVGVLEYARAYIEAECPEQTMIDLMRSFLRPGGVLILAIENQLGLKYFSGSLEDHYGSPYFGINDSYRRDAVTTFGREELTGLLTDSGFSSVELFAPLPDYKLPVSVVRGDLGGGAPDVVSRLLEQSVAADPQNAAHPTFSLERAWPMVSRNGLLGDLANSFLMVASDKPAFRNDTVAWHYSVDRHPAFSKETRFTDSDDGVRVECRGLSSRTPPSLPLKWQIGDSRYLNGVNWWTECVRILNTEGWGVNDLSVWAEVWLKALSDELGIALGGESFGLRVDGRAFDMVPQNLVVSATSATFFDVEWTVETDMPLGVVVVRGLRDSLAKVTACAFTASGAPYNINELVLAILSHLGWFVSKSDFDSMAEFDLRVQSWVRGNESGHIDFSSVGRDWERALKVRSPADRDLLSYNLHVVRGQLEETERAAREAREQADQALILAQNRAAEELTRTVDQALAERDVLLSAHGAALESAAREAFAERDALTRAREESEATLRGELEEATRKASSERDALIQAREEVEARLLAELEELTHTASSERDALIQAREEVEARLLAELEELTHTASSERDALIHTREQAEARLQSRLEEAGVEFQAALEKAQRQAATDRQSSLQALHEAEARFTAQVGVLIEQGDQIRLDAQSALTRAREEAAHAVASLQAELDAANRQMVANRNMASVVPYQTERLRIAEERASRAEQLLQKTLDAKPQAGLAAERVSHAQADDLPAPVFAREPDAPSSPVDSQPVMTTSEAATPVWSRSSQKPSGRLKAMYSNARKFVLKRMRRLAAPGGASGQGRSAPSLRRDVARIRDAGLVRRSWYAGAYQDVPEDEQGLLQHYFSKGSLDGRGPHPLFDPVWYRGSMPGASEGEVDPLIHYLDRGWRTGKAPHPLFDAAWYSARNPDVVTAGVNPLTHYLNYGWREGRNPHPLFDIAWYLRQEPALDLNDVDPLTHYLEQGWRDFRSPHPLFNGVWYGAHHPDVVEAGVNPLAHYLQYGWREGRSAHPLFDAAWYLAHSPDVAEADIDPLTHYAEHGWMEGRAPHPLFDVAAYLEHSPHSAENGGPLLHYLRGGWREGRSPYPLFDTPWYLGQSPQLQGSGYEDPLSHYIAVGSASGFSANPLIDEARVREVSEDGSAPALLAFVSTIQNQNDFTLHKKSRWSLGDYRLNAAVLTQTSNRLNGAA